MFYLLKDCHLRPLNGKKDNGLEPKRSSGSITQCVSRRDCCLHAQAAKNDGPTEASDSLLIELPSYLPMKVTTELD